MQITNLKSEDGELFEDLFLITPKIYEDNRGFFYESWNSQEFNKHTKNKLIFVQDNHSKSAKGVLRGMHYQIDPKSQGKLVRCTSGAIFDVALDLRIKSKTYKKWFGTILDSQNKNQLWIPRGFAHGFLTISELAEVQYKTTNFWDKNFERTIVWNDSKLNINWPIKSFNIKNLIISDKDLNAMNITEAELQKNIFI